MSGSFETTSLLVKQQQQRHDDHDNNKDDDNDDVLLEEERDGNDIPLLHQSYGQPNEINVDDDDYHHHSNSEKGDTVSLDRGMSQMDDHHQLSSSLPTQKRFSFYDAEQVNNGTTSSSSLTFSIQQQKQHQQQQMQEDIHEEKKLPQESPSSLPGNVVVNKNSSNNNNNNNNSLHKSRSHEDDKRSSRNDNKRFSFYNADEVKLVVTTTTTAKKASATPLHVNTSSSTTTTSTTTSNTKKKNRNNNRSNREPSLLLPPPDPTTPCSVATGASADSFEILKSLQETERQRGLWASQTKTNQSNNIGSKPKSRRLASSSTTATTPRGKKDGGEMSVASSDLGSVNSAPATVFSGATVSSGGLYAVRHDGGDDDREDEDHHRHNNNHKEEDEDESANSNPYHDAILEALQLLRSKKSSSSTTTTSALLEAATAASQPSHDRETSAEDEGGADEDHSVASTALTDLIESKRREWDRDQNDDDTNDVAVVAVEDDGNNDDERELLASAVDPNLLLLSSSASASFSRRRRPLALSFPAATTKEVDTIPLGGNVVANADSQNSQQQQRPSMELPRKDRADSMAESSLGMSSAEDMVQRSVERVLLAILERASTSRSRGGGGGAATPSLKNSSSRYSAAKGHHDTDDDDDDGETATSGANNSNCPTNEDSLLQAMHELFPSTATASAMNKTFTPFPVTSISSTNRLMEDDHPMGVVLSPMVTTTSAPPLVPIDDNIQVDPTSPSENGSSLFPTKSVVEELLGDVELDSESAALEHFLSLGTTTSSASRNNSANEETGDDLFDDTTAHLALDSLRLQARQQQQQEQQKLQKEQNTSLAADQELEDFERELENEIADIEREMRDVHISEDSDARDDSGTAAVVAVAVPGVYRYDQDEHDDEDGPVAIDSLVDVLGPLCHGTDGMTGVVLEHSPQSKSKMPIPPPPPLPPPPPILTVMSSPGSSSNNNMAKRSPPSIFDSLSSAIKDAENLVNFVAQAISPERSPPADRKDASLKDKYSALMSDDDDAEAPDNEAHELMKTLCAHLLPEGMNGRRSASALIAAAASGSPKGLDSVPAWDESNPNEPGYRIIRLTKQQLRRVEREYSRMIKFFQDRNERRRRLGRHDVVSDWNGVAGTLKDDDDINFQRDLEEAEEILNREEKRMDDADHRGEGASERKKNVKEPSRDSKDDGESSETDFDSTDDNDDTTEAEEICSPREGVEGHPDFPGIRPSGKGEMGDLEYFHLPIIYKSHVTGFEPTKDLFLEPGNVVAGQYLVENELGSAAFSTTYRCIDLNSGNGEYHEEVCLKVIKNTKDFFDQSLDEIKILELLRQTGLCHENHIIEMKTFFYHREHLIIVTELLRQNLFEFGKFILDNDEEPYFTLTRLAYITRQVLIALTFVHKLGLVHSDVKPENILLGSYSRAQVKLIDFGSSCYLTDRQSSYIQSRSYRAPEVVLGLPYDGKIDIWSLGCVVAEMFTGEVTFQNDSIVSMLCRIEAICGAFPRHMVSQGRQSNRFFTKSGLLYEAVDASDGDAPSGKEGSSLDLDDDDDSQRLERFDVFQPKVTTLSSRLGFVADLMELSHPTEEEKEQALFVDFCRSLLTIDPDLRPSASQALEHPWIVAASTLTEEDIKYPTQ